MLLLLQWPGEPPLATAEPSAAGVPALSGGSFLYGSISPLSWVHTGRVIIILLQYENPETQCRLM